MPHTLCTVFLSSLICHRHLYYYPISPAPAANQRCLCCCPISPTPAAGQRRHNRYLLYLFFSSSPTAAAAHRRCLLLLSSRTPSALSSSPPSSTAGHRLLPQPLPIGLLHCCLPHLPPRRHPPSLHVAATLFLGCCSTRAQLPSFPLAPTSAAVAAASLSLSRNHRRPYPPTPVTSHRCHPPLTPASFSSLVAVVFPIFPTQAAATSAASPHCCLSSLPLLPPAEPRCSPAAGTLAIQRHCCCSLQRRPATPAAALARPPLPPSLPLPLLPSNPQPRHCRPFFLPVVVQPKAKAAAISPCCRSLLQPRPPHLLPSAATSVAALSNCRQQPQPPLAGPCCPHFFFLAGPRCSPEPAAPPYRQHLYNRCPFPTTQTHAPDSTAEKRIEYH
ncbi:hypothetical protein BHE74_00022897 [Ensete ventricosum]|nr:hypothetical protein BHE74_00022897 [Ensete ventricosum]